MESSLRDPALLWWDEVGSGPPIVLIHGFGANATTWDPWIPELSRRNRCIRIELKGFGRAPAPRDGRWTVPDLAEPVVGLLDELDLRDATLVGHSLGGAVILAATLRLMEESRETDPPRVGRLVSVAGAAYRQHEPPFVRIARLPGLAAVGFRLAPKRPLVKLVFRTIVERPEVLTDDLAEAYAAPLRRPEVQRAALEVARNLFTPELESFTRRYPEIRVPLLCLWGDGDRVVPPWVGRRLAAEVPGGRYVELAGCGHMVTEERPGESLACLLDFLEATRSEGAD